MIKDLIYILLIGSIVNMVPVFVRKWKFLNYPADFGLKFRGYRIFGDNKTIRGLFWGIVFSLLLVYILVDTFSWDVPYSFGFFIAVGVLGGDLIKSFIKRQLGHKPGERFIPFDQLDSAIGLGIVLLLYRYSLVLILVLILIWFFGHIGIRHIGYWLKITKEKW